MNHLVENVLLPIGVVFSLIIAVLVVVFGLAVAVSYGAAKWNCGTWHANTGEQTRVIAAECYVLEPTGWVSFDSHVKNHHVEVKN